METATPNNILNVTLLEPRMKHPTIFKCYDELKPGESLIIHNDHDPKPLYYQLLGERGNVFTWEYLAEGPEWWKVKIRKHRDDENDSTLGELAAADIRKSQVFKKYGLDFSCGGKKTVKEACAAKGLDVTRIEKELQELDKMPAVHSLPYAEWSPGFLADFIVNTHHRYIRKNLPDIKTYAEKVAEVHGSHHSELKEINSRVQELATTLTSHIDKEENQIFRLIRSGENDMANPELRIMLDQARKEHDGIAANVRAIRELTSDYALPEDACASYTLLYNNLKALEEDLELHIHLENNILFTRVIEELPNS